MKKNNLKRFLASLLAVLMLASATGMSPAVFAEGEDILPQTEGGEVVQPELKESATPIEVLIKDNFSDEQVKEALANALLTNAEQVDVQSLEWTYTCAVKGTYKVGPVPAETENARKATVSVLTGDTQTVKKDKNTVWPHYTATYTYPALKDNTDGEYTLYLNNQSVTIKKVAKLSSAITVVNTVPEIVIPYNADGSVNTAKLNESIFNAVVTGTTPAGLTYDKLNYSDNFSEGEQTVTISFAGNEDYFPTTAQATVKFVDSRATAFESKERPASLNIGFVGNNVDVDATKNAVLKQLVNKVGSIDIDKIKVEYMPSVLGIKTGTYKDFSSLSVTDISYYKEIKTDIRLTYAGDSAHKGYSAEFKDLKFADNRIQSTIVFKENATITYNMDASVQKEAIIKNAIDYEQSKLPAETDVNDFTVKINGKEIPNAKLDAGENQTIYISYNGNTDYKPCKDAERTINVEKANVKVSMKRFTTVYAGQDINKDVLKVALDPNDPAIDVYLVFAGINTKLDTSVNLVLTKQQWAVIENISKFQQFIFDLDKDNKIFKDKTTLQQKLEKGMTIGEFKAYMLDFIDVLEKATEIPGLGSLIKAEMEKYGISIDSLKAMATIFDKLTAFSDDTQIALGAPKHAGLYTAFALAVNKNYNTGVANGIVLIAMNTAGMKLVPNADIKGKSINAETAKQMRETGTPALVTLYCGDSAENVDQSSIHYWFTGVNTIYAGSKMPTKPGKYIVTASVYGGDYLAPPVTFTFRITK